MTTTNQPLLLDVSSIEVIYNHVILVFKGVSLKVTQGRIVALLGGNGAGKTTTLRAVSNRLQGKRGEVTKGNIQLRGERIEKFSPAQMVARGVVQVMEGRHCYILENGRVVMEGSAASLRDNADVKEFYLGMGGSGGSGADDQTRRSFRDAKSYRRRKRWLA